jgi:hypothetical protein
MTFVGGRADRLLTSVIPAQAGTHASFSKFFWRRTINGRATRRGRRRYAAIAGSDTSFTMSAMMSLSWKSLGV